VSRDVCPLGTTGGRRSAQGNASVQFFQALPFFAAAENLKSSCTSNCMDGSRDGSRGSTTLLPSNFDTLLQSICEHRHHGCWPISSPEPVKTRYHHRTTKPKYRITQYEICAGFRFDQTALFVQAKPYCNKILSVAHADKC